MSRGLAKPKSAVAHKTAQEQVRGAGIVEWIPLVSSSRLGYIRSMKIKTSVTLSEELVSAIDRYLDRFKNRSAFLEAAARTYIAKLARDERNAGDLEIINRQAARLNSEAFDVLSYQVIP